jgi:hypothetical protein
MSLWYVVGALLGLALCSYYGANYSTLDYLTLAGITTILAIILEYRNFLYGRHIS